MSSPQLEREPEHHLRQVGLLSDPEFAPADVAQHLAQRLPTELADGFGEQRSVTVAYERLPAGPASRSTMLDHAAARRDEWDVAVVICLTDLPLLAGRRPVVADLDVERGVAMVSLPALGAMRLRHNVAEVVLYLVAELLDHVEGRELPSQLNVRKLERITPDDTPVSLRLLATRGRWRLLVGMVRANRPWRLARGLSSASVAAFALSAFFLTNSTVWSLSDALRPWRLVGLTVISVTVLTGWLIVNHRMWERSRDQPDPAARARARLYNAATLCTVSLGVGCFYVGLFVVLLAGAALVLAPDVVGATLGHPPTVGSYVNVAWLTTCAATLAGALGSSLDTDEAVRAAAYNYREQQRQAQRDSQQ